jgi:hypothetical protein
VPWVTMANAQVQGANPRGLMTGDVGCSQPSTPSIAATCCLIALSGRPAWPASRDNSAHLIGLRPSSHTSFVGQVGEREWLAMLLVRAAVGSPSWCGRRDCRCDWQGRGRPSTPKV